MENRGTINQQFTAAWNRCADLYNDDRLEECIEECKALLEDSAIPRYHQIKTGCLLAACLPDVSDARMRYFDAEAVYRIVDQWHPPGQGDLEHDDIMRELRSDLDEVKEAIYEEIRQDGMGDDEVEDDQDEDEDEGDEIEGEDDEEAVQNNVSHSDALVEGAGAEQLAEDEPEELLEAGALAPKMDEETRSHSSLDEGARRLKEREIAGVTREQAAKERERTARGREHAAREREHAAREREQAAKERAQAAREQTQAAKEREHAANERARRTLAKEHAINTKSIATMQGLVAKLSTKIEQIQRRNSEIEAELSKY